jgi:hypothetical protein
MKSKPADFIVNHSRSSLREMQSVYRKYLGGHPGRLTVGALRSELQNDNKHH